MVPTLRRGNPVFDRSGGRVHGAEAPMADIPTLERGNDQMPSREVVSDLERAAYGEITVSEVIANIGKRHREAEIRGQ